MTSFYEDEITCVNCGQPSKQRGLEGVSAFGSPDLDLRPPPMKRDTMHVWLQRCPHCDYVAPHLSTAIGDLKVLHDPAYRETLRDEKWPDLARMFLAYGLLLRGEAPLAAAHARLHAAWVCDDLRRAISAIDCRLLAAEWFGACAPLETGEQGIAQCAVYVDVLRRAGRFDAADAECERLLESVHLDEVERQIFELQRRLIRNHDMTCHLLEEYKDRPT